MGRAVARAGCGAGSSLAEHLAGAPPCGHRPGTLCRRRKPRRPASMICEALRYHPPSAPGTTTPRAKGPRLMPSSRRGGFCQPAACTCAMARASLSFSSTSLNSGEALPSSAARTCRLATHASAAAELRCSASPARQRGRNQPPELALASRDDKPQESAGGAKERVARTARCAPLASCAAGGARGPGCRSRGSPHAPQCCFPASARPAGVRNIDSLCCMLRGHAMPAARRHAGGFTRSPAGPTGAWPTSCQPIVGSGAVGPKGAGNDTIGPCDALQQVPTVGFSHQVPAAVPHPRPPARGSGPPGDAPAPPAPSDPLGAPRHPSPAQQRRKLAGGV